MKLRASLRSAKTLALIVALLAVAVLFARWWRTHLVVSEVVPGVLRSNQPRPEDLSEISKRWGVRSVVNLRGHYDGESWHVAEVQACRTLGLTHTDIQVKISDWVAQHEVRRFVDLLERRSGSVLLHCKNGADRSGWAAATASLLAGSPLEQGLAELSAAKGHICRLSGCPLCGFFDTYRSYLAAQGIAHSGAIFRRWIMEIYCPEPYNAELELIRSPETMRFNPAQPIAFAVKVTNRSSTPWVLAPGERGIRLGARALGPFSMPPEAPLDTFRTPMNSSRNLARAGLEDGQIPPSGERIFELVFPAPPDPGVYILQIDMLDEHVRWFSDLGPDGLILELEVVAPEDTPPPTP